MPSGKTHDAITVVLAIPAFAIAFAVTRDVWLSMVIAVGFLFGGFMFGPDLDTLSLAGKFFDYCGFRTAISSSIDRDGRTG